MTTDRVLCWIRTGNHKFETAFVDRKAADSTVNTEPGGEAAPEASTSEQTSTVSHESTLTTSNSNELLIGSDNDILIPTTDRINHTFLRGERIWQSYVTDADLLPFGCISKGWLDPYILIQNIPPLPEDLPRRRFITGQALWHVPHPELSKSCQQENPAGDGAWNPEYVYNFSKTFYLEIEKPTECGISSAPRPDDEQSNSIAILTLCWAYMFTIRFLEMQKRPIHYSSARLTPVLSNQSKPRTGDIVLHLGSASRELVRWLCALLAPGLGWAVKGSLPPWAAHYSGASRFVIATEMPFHFLEDERPPSSKKATGLLIELCTLLDFGTPTTNGSSLHKTLQQPIAGFLAALALPFYNELNLQPQLPMPKFTTSLGTHTPLGYIRNYVKDIPYFMTLSISPASFGSVIWSIFWEPGLDCNLVSAWFGSILEVIRPIIRDGNIDTLSKIFAFRRERVGLLWRAVFDLGDLKILDMILSYLETHEERWGGSFAGPDIDVAAWTGSPQSFFDEGFSGTYRVMSTQVPRSDLLRHRFNFRLGDADWIRSGWQPFGSVAKEQIEPELWPGLELGCPREYKHWVWWLKGKDDYMIAQIQRGFKHDKPKYPKYPKYVSEKLFPENSQVAVPRGFGCNVRLTPSFEATWSTLHYGAKEASGDRSLEALLIKGLREHRWFAESRGI